MDENQLDEEPIASCCFLFIILSIAGESRLNSHSLTADTANASGSLQVAVTEAPSQVRANSNCSARALQMQH
jgi:hypothetical protein